MELDQLTLADEGGEASVVHQCFTWSGIITAAKSVIGVIFKNKDVIKVTDVARG